MWLEGAALYWCPCVWIWKSYHSNGRQKGSMGAYFVRIRFGRALRTWYGANTIVRLPYIVTEGGTPLFAFKLTLNIRSSVWTKKDDLQ